MIRAVRAVAAGRRYVGAGLSNAVIDSLSGKTPGMRHGDSLTVREREILRRVAAGLTSSQIAVQISLSPRTVETYRLRLMEKLGIKDLPSLVKYAIRHGITPLE